MPQLDKITFFSQIFWLLVTFLSTYIILLQWVLPVIAANIKVRRKQLDSSSEESLGIPSDKELIESLENSLREPIILTTDSINNAELDNSKELAEYLIDLQDTLFIPAAKETRRVFTLIHQYGRRWRTGISK